MSKESRGMNDVTDDKQAVPCAVYRGRRRNDSYLFVERRDDFSRVPDALLTMLGGVEFVMDLELWPQRRLALSSSAEVMQQLQVQGYYLQMPRRPADALM